MDRFLRWLSAFLAIIAVGDAVALLMRPPWWVTGLVLAALWALTDLEMHRGYLSQRARRRGR